MINRLKELLLEFDPKKRKIMPDEPGKSRRARQKRSDAIRKEFGKLTEPGKLRTKVGNRAMARGGESKKGASPKGKLPESLNKTESTKEKNLKEIGRKIRSSLKRTKAALGEAETRK